MVSTPIQPDFSRQAGSAYKGAIDAAAAVHRRGAGAFAPVASVQWDFVPGDVSAGADTIAQDDHLLFDDDVVRVSTTGTLPDPLAAGTDYHVVNADADTIQLSASEGGAAIDLTDGGSGIHTLELTESLNVRLAAGAIPAIDGIAAEVAAQISADLSAPSGNPRYDIVYVDRASGAIGVAAGSEAASPSDPSLPAGRIPVARIRWTVGMTEITNADLDDLRDGWQGLGQAAGEDVQASGSGDLMREDGDGSALTGIEVGARDIKVLALRVAALEGDRLNMVDGIADPFTDETDVDTGSCANQTYDAGGDFYHNPATQPNVAGEATVSMSSGGPAVTANPERLNDGTTSGQSQGTNAGQNNIVFGFDFGAANDKTINHYSFFGSPSGDAPKDYTLEGSANAADWDVVDTQTGQSSIGDGVERAHSDIGNTTAYRYYRVNSTVSTGGSDTRLSEIELLEDAPPPDMTLVSESFTAAAAPDTARLLIEAKPADAITLNTDLTGEVSRDGGTTWTAATLALVGTLEDGTNVYSDENVDISGQPSGTDMLWRVKALNEHEIEVHGVVLQWQ